MKRLSAAYVALMLAMVIIGCGDSGGSAASPSTVQMDRQATLAHKLQRLRRKLRRQQDAVRARHAHELRKTKRKANSAPVPAESIDTKGLAGELDGEFGAVVGPLGSGEPLSVGGLRSGSAWSTSKVLIALRLLQEVGGPAGLSATQADEMRRALTLSDNDAAAALFADLERSHGGTTGASSALDEVLRQAGDSTTQVATQGRDGFSSYGQTDWSLLEQQHFIELLAAGCLSTAASREYVLDLMGEVSSDTWGLGSAGLPARWKGGWGPGVDGRYLVRQMGILYVGDREAAVTLAAIPADGQFETAQAMATRIAEWLAEKARSVASVPSGC